MRKKYYFETFIYDSDWGCVMLILKKRYWGIFGWLFGGETTEKEISQTNKIITMDVIKIDLILKT